MGKEVRMERLVIAEITCLADMIHELKEFHGATAKIVNADLALARIVKVLEDGGSLPSNFNQALVERYARLIDAAYEKP